MIVDAIQSLAQMLTKSSATPSGQADRQAAYQLQLTPGQQVQAELMASLPNQRYLARIAGNLFNIELPIIVQPGETLQLTYLTGEPNPTFTLSRAGNSSSPVTISDTGRLLNQISSSPDQRQLGAMGRNGSVLNGPPSDTSIFAKLLGEALTLNGTFYESHLLQWYLGERQAMELLREPQGKLSKRGRAPGGAEGEKLNGDGVADGKRTDSMMDELLDSGRPKEPVDPRLMTIVREQLQTLDTGRVIWMGEVWPRQEMEWSVQEDQKGNVDGGGKGWTSTMRLELPNLGGVTATLAMERDGVSIRINAESASSSELMQTERHSLEQAMSDAGIRLIKVAIEHEENGQ